MAVCEKPDMADAVEPIWYGVQQKPPHELVSRQRHHLVLAPCR